MHLYLIISLIFLFVGHLNAVAQIHGLGRSNNEQWKILQKNDEKSKEMISDQKKDKNTFVQKNAIITKDSVYYAKVVKKHGWWIGVGKKLTLKDASRLSYYFKLSKKNQAGNWTFIEAFDGYGNPTAYHDIGTYLVNQFDDEDLGANSDWKNKLLTVCKWEIVSDASGKEVIQERALDYDGDVVYIYNPVKVGMNEYTGSFIDSWGMPIYMRTDSLGNDVGFANFVHITRDDRGYEVLLSYTDKLGFPQKNKDGAYMTRKEYDDFGNQIIEASQNIVGDNMIDDFGNCGWESTYDKKNGWQMSARYFNAEWKPIRMPNLRGGSGNVYGFRYEKDEYGRDTTIVVIDGNGNPDVNEFGVHKIKRVYNDNGRWKFMGYYDLKGNLCAGEKNEIAQVINEFDEKGNIILIEYKDKDGNFVVNSNGFCKKNFKYNKQNNVEISEIEYITDSYGNVVKSFEYFSDDNGNTVRTWYQENKQRVDSVDHKGRNILLAWYDLQRKPIENEGLHKNITIYDDVNNVQTELWLDKDGNSFVDSDRAYSKDICIIDSVTNIMTNYQYWHGMLKQSFQKQFTPGFGSITAQWDITPYGEHARVGWWNNLHYRCNVDYTMYGKIRTMVGRNEFDEPAYLTFLGDTGEVYYFSDINNGKRRYYDEYGMEILDGSMDEFKSKLPRAFCIEVTDTAIAYPLGLRNGDVIISYGDWTTDLNVNVDYFYLEAILKANQDKQITVLRHHPETISSEIIQIKLPIGKTSDLGFYPHMIYYTQKEKQRLLNTCNNYGVNCISPVISKDTTVILAVQIKGSLESTRLYHLPIYNIKDPGIVLYAKEEYNKGIDTWSMLDNIEQWNRQKMFRIKGANLYMTQDLSTIRHIDKQSRGLGGMRFVPLKIDIDIYNNLLKCYNSLGDSIIGATDSIATIKTSFSNLKQKQLVGKWNTVIEIDEGSVDLTLDLDKKDHAKMVMSLGLGGEISDGITLKIKASVTNSGSWSLQGNELCLDMDDESCQMNLDGIEIEGVDESRRKEFMEQIAGRESEFLELLASNVPKNIPLNSIDIESVSKTELTIKIEEDIITFKKIK